MAHFAQLNENNKVIQVIVVNNDTLDPNNEEESGIAFCQSLFPSKTVWVQTSYNANFRKNYAGIGYTYDPVNNWFYAPQPFPSWTLDDNAKWQAPVPMPTDEKFYIWNETTLSWDEVANGSN